MHSAIITGTIIVNRVITMFNAVNHWTNSIPTFLTDYSQALKKDVNLIIEISMIDI